MIPLDDYTGIHGNNERISIDNIRDGTDAFIQIVETVVYK